VVPIGYYSDVALKVTREDKEHGIPLTQLWSQFVAEKNDPVVAEWEDAIEVSDDSWTFHAENTKWYADEAFGYPEVRYIEDWRERMLLLVGEHPDTYTYSWVIVGEEYGDITADYWGHNNDYALAPMTTIVGI
jgi:hypothetical protein